MSSLSELKAEFDDILLDVSIHLRLPSKFELDAYKAYIVTNGSVGSALPTKLEWCYLLNPVGKARRERIEFLSSAFGLSSDKAKPAYLPTKPISLIQDCLDRHSITPEFVKARGMFQRWYGMYLEILSTEEATVHHLEREIKAAVKAGDTTLQQYWYAYWVQKHVLEAVPKEAWTRTREEQNQVLADLCWRINIGEIRPLRYPREWFGQMTKPLDDNVQSSFADPSNRRLATTYTRLSFSALADMTSNPLLMPKDLPPLAASFFRP